MSLFPSTIRRALFLTTTLVSLTSHATIFGYFDAADLTHLSGWACDSADFTTPIQVHLYASNIDSTQCLYETGHPRVCFIAAVTATVPREAQIGSYCGGYTQRGFDIPSPAILADGYYHSIYAYGISLAGPSYMLLGAPRPAQKPLLSQPYLNSITDLPLVTGTVGPVNQLYNRFGDIPDTGLPTQVITWPVGDYTGFYPADPASAQRGVSQTWIGSLARQGYQDTIGLQLHPQSSGTVGPIPNSQFEYEFGPAFAPWKYSNDDLLRFTEHIMFPAAFRSHADDALYVGNGALFRIPSTNYFFTYGIGNMADYQRCGESLSCPCRPQEGIGFADAMPFVASFLSTSTATRYTRTVSGSEGMRCDTWNYYNTFSYEIDGHMFQQALRDINAVYVQCYLHDPATCPTLITYPEDPSLYQMTAAGTGIEAYYSSPNSVTFGGYSFKGLEMIHVSAP